MKEKNFKIPTLALKIIFGLILLAFAGVLGDVNGNVRFEGVEAKFFEIFGQNDTVNGVNGKLTSDQIKILLSDDILDLNEDQNEFLKEEIFLIYQNLTENLKAKVRNSSINFQGQSVEIKSLLGNETEKILQTLNSTQIFDLIKDEKSIKIGKEMENLTKIYIQREFQDKSIEYHETENLSDLIEKSKNEKLILLSDDAGTGKTTTFKHLTWEWKQKYPQKWIQYVDLKSKIEIYQKYQNKNFNLKEILTEIFDLKDLNAEIFEILFDYQNVVILWDGFDEISPTYSDFILKLIERIKNQTQNIQFISTRTCCDYSIRKHLNCQVYKLEPLTKADNEEFLNKFYDSKNLTESQIENAKEKNKKMIEKVQNDNWPRDYVKSPLMLEMIAEVSLSDDEHFDGTNLYTIYEKLTDAKISLADENEKKNVKEIFQYFAVKLFKIYSYYDKDFEIIQKYEDKTFDTNFLSHFGILNFNSEGNFDFTFKIFQEFFLAQYLVENLNSETDCDKINEKFEIIVRCIYSEFVQDFITAYFAKNKSLKIDQNLLFCFKNHLELNNLFQNALFFDKRGRYFPDFDRVVELLEMIPFTSESLEILWHLDRNKTFFNEIAATQPLIFIYSFDKIQEIVRKYFPNDEEKQKKLLFGQNQLGSYLFTVCYYHDKFNYDKYLQLLNLTFYFDSYLIKRWKIYDFFVYFKSDLTAEEFKEMLKTHFVDFLTCRGLEMWNKIESEFTREEFQNLIYESRFNGRPLLRHVHDFNFIKLMFKALDGTPDSRFVKFIQNYDKKLWPNTDFLFSNDNLEYVWNVIKNVATKDERKEILQLNLINEDRLPYKFNIFSASIELGTIEKFEFFKDIYEQHFNSIEMREICKKYFDIWGWSKDLYGPKVETVEAFIEYLKSLFTVDELKSKFQKTLEKLFEFYSERENLDFSYPIFNLLKELKTVKELEIIRLSVEFKRVSKNHINWEDLSSLFDFIPTEMDPNELKNISTFADFYDLIEPHLSDDEIRDFFKLNFIKVTSVASVKIWNEIEKKFTREELQELIYESRFEEKPLFWYLRDFNVTKLIFQTLKGKPDSRFVKIIRDGKNLFLNEQSLMLDDNFEVIWNVIENQTTKDERKKILELEILVNGFLIAFFNIFDASIVYGTVEKFELVKNIYEQNFNSTEKMRKFCENNFETIRFAGYPWLPKVETAEAFVEYLKSLFTIDEIKIKFNKTLREIFEFHSKRKNLDYSYPLFSLLKEL